MSIKRYMQTDNTIRQVMVVTRIASGAKEQCSLNLKACQQSDTALAKHPRVPIMLLLKTHDGMPTKRLKKRYYDGMSPKRLKLKPHMMACHQRGSSCGKRELAF